MPFACLELEHASLYLIADGSSSHPQSGELARALLACLIQEFSRLPLATLGTEPLTAALVDMISACRNTLRDQYPTAACSYLLLCLMGDTAFSIHEGDCCLGLITTDNTVNWLNNIHCEANWQGNLSHAEIVRAPSRHRLTRCFSARRSSDPEISHWPVHPTQQWLLATDGFWATLDAQQQLHFLLNGDLSDQYTDDISCLSVITPTVQP